MGFRTDQAKSQSSQTNRNQEKEIWMVEQGQQLTDLTRGRIAS